MSTKIASLYAEIGADTSGLDNGLVRTKKGLTDTGKAAQTAGEKIGKFAKGFGKFALEAGVTALAGSFVVVTKAAMELETEFGKIAALTDTPKSAIAGLRKEVMALSTELPVSAIDLSKALYFISSSGFQGAEAMDVLRASALATTAGLGETQVIADAVTSALNAYGTGAKDAARVTDLLSFAVKEGKGEPAELAGSLGKVLPVAAAAKVGMEDIAAAMAVMTRTGMNADEAATSLRGTIGALLAPAKQSKDALAAIGLTTEDVAAMLSKPGGLVNVLQVMMERTGGNVEQLDMMIPNIRALTGVLSLAGSQGAEYARVLRDAYDSEGLTAAGAEIMGDTMEAKLKKAENAVNNFGVAVTEKLLPGLGDAAEAATVLLTWTDKIDAAFVETSKTISKSAPTYAEYKKQIIGIGIAAEKITESDIASYEEEVARGFMTAEDAASALRIKLDLLSESEWWNVKAAEAAGFATKYLADRNKYFTEQADAAAKANSGVGFTALKTADELKEEAKAAQEAAEALGNAKVSWLEYVAGFSEFDSTKLVELQISQLKEAIVKTGDPAGILTAKLLDLERQTGNITPKAEAAQRSYSVLSEMFLNGYLTAADLKTSLEKLDKASSDGKVSVDELGLSASDARTYLLYMRDAANEAKSAINNIPSHKLITIELRTQTGGIDGRVSGEIGDIEMPSVRPATPNVQTGTPGGSGGYAGGHEITDRVVGRSVTVLSPITVTGAQDPKATAQAVGRYLGSILDQRLRTQ